MEILKDIAYGPHGARNLMDIYLPAAGPAPRPVVLCIHGGGWRAGGKDTYAWHAKALAGRGFVAVSMTYRFWPDACCPAQIDDAQRAVRWLRAHAAEYNLDPGRFGAFGGSAGGHLASCLGLMETRDKSDPAPYSSRVQCVVDCYGPVDMVTMLQSASVPLIEGFMGKPLAGAEAEYAAASPVSYVAPDAPPFLIIHGTRDDGLSPGSVPIEQSLNFNRRLQEAGADSTLLVLEGAGHGFSGDPTNPHMQRMWAAAVPFLERHLRPTTP